MMHVRQTQAAARGQSLHNSQAATFRSSPKVRDILAGGRVQTKLKIGAANDPAEREADRVADQVMRMAMPAPEPDAAAAPTPPSTGSNLDSGPNPIRRMCAGCQDELQRQPADKEEDLIRPKETPGAAPALSAAAEGAIRGLGSGTPIPASERAFFEPRFGRGFSDVRIHTGGAADASARSINARAYTLGSDIAFARGEYTPGSSSGRRLMAHELTHVGQQESGFYASIRRQPFGEERQPFTDPRGPGSYSTLPYRQAHELADCIRIHGDGSAAYCRAEALGEAIVHSRKPVTSLGTSAGGRDIKAYHFRGRTDERALIIGGVHGSEQSGIEVANRLIADLKKGPRPHFTVIIVPVLFPDNFARAQAAPTTTKKDSSVGRMTKIGNKVSKVDPNRNFPKPGESLATARARGKRLGKGGPVDAKGRRIEAENIMLLELIERFKPSRIASVHAKRLPPKGKSHKAKPGIFGDPHSVALGATATEKAAAATATTADKTLALAMARHAKKAGARVPGNRLGEASETAVYGAATHGTGTSLGGWAPRAVSEGGAADRASMTIITVEVQHYFPSSVASTAKEKASRIAELQAHSKALYEVFLEDTP